MAACSLASLPGSGRGLVPGAGMSLFSDVGIRGEVLQALRFCLVGLANTAIGYGLILGWLLVGMGDYGANALGFAMGLPISYALHQRLTFRRRERRNWREAKAYGLAFAAAYAVNLGVIALGRASGHAGSPLVQGLAVVAYAVSLYGLTRCLVFRSARAR